MSLNDQIRNGKTKIYRDISIKRRLSGTGLFESEWESIKKDVQKWGKVKSEVDAVRRDKFRFGSSKVIVDNTEGKYNDSDDQNSLWFGYAGRQRTLVKIEAGYRDSTLGADGIYTRIDFPAASNWDNVYWDANGFWDGTENNLIFGLLSGDIPYKNNNTISLNILPLTQVFRDYPASELDGFTSTGITASEFIGIVRDQTDGSGNFIFRPFFGDTTTYWNIATTTVNYDQLNTSTAKDIRDKNVWDVIEKLAESETFVPYVDKSGTFNFVSRDATSSTVYEFFGVGYFNNEFGNTIKKINKYGTKVSKFYSRVQVKYTDTDTITSYVSKQNNFKVSSENAAWNFGFRTLGIENFWIPDTATADIIATNIFNDVGSVKRELDMTVSFNPNITPFDLIEVSYDASGFSRENLWGVNNWTTELTWDASKGDAIKLTSKELKALSIEHDLDNMETRIIASE